MNYNRTRCGCCEPNRRCTSNNQNCLRYRCNEPKIIKRCYCIKHRHCHHHHHHHCQCNCKCPDNKHSTCSCVVTGIGAQLEIASPININHRDAIKFDKILNHSNQNIRYDQQSGTFHLPVAGTYQINWDISVEGSHHKSYIRFAILAGNKIQGESTLPLTVGQLSGTCLLTIENPTDVSLINNTEDIVQLSRYTPVANITISKTSCTPKKEKI